MSACIEAERGERLVMDNPKNTFIHSDFHTADRGILSGPSFINRPSRPSWRMQPDAKNKHTYLQSKASRWPGFRLLMAKW